jgi:acyl-CoA hydrolase
MNGKTVAASNTIMTELVMPNDTNPLGNLMGGNLMRWMDIAGGICAARHSESFVVTASVDHVSFSDSVKVGEIVTLNAKITRAFSSSMEIYIEVFTATIPDQKPRKSNHAYLTFVALDKDTLKPKLVPSVIPLTEEEEKRYEGAVRRRELRLILSGRMEAKDAKDLRDYFNKL